MDNTPLFLPLLKDDDDKSSSLKNRIRKNYRHIRKWANKTVTNCFRIYDRDIKEYPLVIDYYAGRFCVQYFSSDRDNDEASQALQEEVNSIIHSFFTMSSQHIYWRSRIKRKKMEQYEKTGGKKIFLPS